MTSWASVLIRRTVATVVVVWGMSAASASANPITLSINSATTTVNVGDTFSVAVDVAEITDLYAFQFDLMFNDTLLDPVFVIDPADPFDLGGFSIEGSFLSQGGPTFFGRGSYNDAGTIAFTFGLLLDAVPGVSGFGTLATLMFTATEAGPATFSLVGDILLTDSLGDLIQLPNEFGDASVTINNINSVNDTTTVGQLLSILLCGTGLGAIVRRRLEKLSRS